MNINKRIKNNVLNIPGWRTNRKIIVIESDDWGSIRMPSLEAFNALLKEGIPVDKSPYCLYDKLESSEDLEMLYAVLLKHADANGKHPIITANCVTANPDFERISTAKFDEYYFESVQKTFERYYSVNNPFNLWMEGLNARLFYPQFHGREHVNVPFWIKTLKEGDKVFTKAFANQCWGISTDIYGRYPKSIQATFDYDSLKDLNFLENSVLEGLKMFESMFGYKSKSFIPNNFIWPNELNEIIKNNGVEYLQGMKFQLLPKPEGLIKREKIRRIGGQTNQNGLINIVRNVSFEPSLSPKENKIGVLENTLKEIENSFFWNKPAIISTHRINFMGGLDTQNRKNNLHLLDSLFYKIISKWPDIEFLTSVELGDIIAENSK